MIYGAHKIAIRTARRHHRERGRFNDHRADEHRSSGMEQMVSIDPNQWEFHMTRFE